jgi:hypothetical protein
MYEARTAFAYTGNVTSLGHERNRDGALRVQNLRIEGIGGNGLCPVGRMLEIRADIIHNIGPGGLSPFMTAFVFLPTIWF